MYLHTTAVANH